MTKIIFAMSAHAHADAVKESIATFMQEPECECILFDGGNEHTLSRQLDIEVCPNPTTIRYARNYYRFHYDVMRYLYESKRNYEFVAFVEGDMCLLKKGFYNSLCRTMSGSEYMAAEFHEILDSTMRPGPIWTIGDAFLSKWEGWKHLFPGIRYPYGCFNPGNVARKEYVDRLFQQDLIEAVVSRAERSPLRALEEVLWPSLAAAYAKNPVNNPGTCGIRNCTHSSAELKRYLWDPNVFMIHRLSMDIAAPDRQFVRTAWEGGNTDSFCFYPAKDTRPWYERALSSYLVRAKRNIRSIQLWMSEG